jgi:hypothetical protein
MPGILVHSTTPGHDWFAYVRTSTCERMALSVTELAGACKQAIIIIPAS